MPVRHATEHFLYWLKGAMWFDLWFEVAHRPTRDADFLGFGPMEAGVLAGTVHGTPFDPRPQPIDSPPRPPAGGLRAWSPKAGYLSRSAIRRNG